MDALKFQWDKTKAAENLIKHGISKKSDSIIRIISARKATRNEAKYYTGEKP